MSSSARREGFAAAARVRRSEMLDMAELVAGREAVLVTHPPAPSTLMLEVQSPVGGFCLTEVVVTTAAVAIGGQQGWAVVLGYDEEGALAGAILDAMPGADGESLATSALAAEAELRRQESILVAATKVGD